MANVEERHLAELTFQEVARALRVLSSAYVERRQRLEEGAALSGAGKRAAFALFYAPLHFLIVRHAIAALTANEAEAFTTVVDLGCGTGAAGAAWADANPSVRRAIGIDRNSWTLGEAARTYRAFGVAGDTRRSDVATVPLPRSKAAFVAAFTMNELADKSRDALFMRLIERARQGAPVLVVEPLAGFVAPWWGRWARAAEAIGGRADQWRVEAELPAIVAKLDRAAGLNHREITGRTIWIGGRRLQGGPFRPAIAGGQP